MGVVIFLHWSSLGQVYSWSCGLAAVRGMIYLSIVMYVVNRLVCACHDGCWQGLKYLDLIVWE